MRSIMQLGVGARRGVFGLVCAACALTTGATGALAEPVCLVNLGSTLLRINADGNGGVEQFATPLVTLVALTQVPAGVQMGGLGGGPGAGPGDIIGMDSATPNRLFKIVNAQNGTPGLVHIGNCAANTSSMVIVNGQLHTVDSGGLVRRFEVTNYTQVGADVDTTANINGIGGLAFDGNQTWYALSTNTNSLYRYNHPPVANSMTLVGTTGVDVASCGMEWFEGQAWAATKVGGNLVVGTCSTQTGTLTARWQIATSLGGNVGFVTFARPGPTCDGIDFNNDGSSFDPTDIDAFLSVFSEGPCIPASATCNDIDFNNDGSLFDPCDIDSFLLVFSEGPCTACGA